jgi:hypothetical protein
MVRCMRDELSRVLPLASGRPTTVFFGCTSANFQTDLRTAAAAVFAAIAPSKIAKTWVPGLKLSLIGQTDISVGDVHFLQMEVRLKGGPAGALVWQLSDLPPHNLAKNS